MATTPTGKELNATRRNVVHDESESDSDGPTLHRPTEHDRTVLEDEEQEKPLVGYTNFGRRPKSNNEDSFHAGHRERRWELQRQHNAERRRGKGDKNEQGQLLYEMEEGSSRDDASSRSSSSSVDLDPVRQRPNSSTKVCTLYSLFASRLRHLPEATPEVPQYHNRYEHISPFRPAGIWILQEFEYSTSKAFISKHLQRNVDFWPHHNSHLPRRFSSGLSPPESHTYARLLHY